jgi:hypothetical protein
MNQHQSLDYHCFLNARRNLQNMASMPSAKEQRVKNSRGQWTTLSALITHQVAFDDKHRHQNFGHLVGFFEGVCVDASCSPMPCALVVF